MKLWTYIMAALMGLPAVIGQESSLMEIVTQFPGCAISCFGESIGKTQCKLSDQACLCNDKSLELAMTGCVLSNCTIKQALMVKNLTATACHEPIRDKSGQYVAVSNIFGIISAIFVIQRFAYKYWAKMEFGLDDWSTLLTIVVGVPTTIINAHGVAPNGMGRDTWTLTYENITEFGRFFYILEIIYFIEVALSKITILLFYIRIFPTTEVRRVLWGTVAFTVLFGMAFTFSAVFQCAPIAYYWLKWDGTHQGHCVDINAIAWSNAAISIVLDAWMLAIPLWQLRTLNLDWRKKVGVGLMFSVGTFVTIVSILRLKSLVNFGSNSTNPTWEFFDVGIWSTVEINVALICACLPALRLLLVRLFPKLLGTTQRYYAKYGGASGANKSTLRRTSRPLGTISESHVDRSQHRPEPPSKHIIFQKTFTVEYGEHHAGHDEAYMVHMKDMEMKSNRSQSCSSASSPS